MANDYEKEKKYNSLLSNYLGKEEIKKLAKKIINLSKTDFPEGNNLEILEIGEINKK